MKTALSLALAVAFVALLAGCPDSGAKQGGTPAAASAAPAAPAATGAASAAASAKGGSGW